MVTYSYRARDVSLPKDIPSACHPVLLRWPLGSRFSAGAELCLALFQGHLWEPARRGMILSSCWGRQTGDLDCVCVCERERSILHISSPGHRSVLSPQVPWASLKVAGRGLCANLAPGRCSSPPRPAPWPTWEGRRGLQTHAPLSGLQDSAS